jgi:hypothetical protein
VSALTNVTTLVYTWYNCVALTSAPDVSALTKVTTIAGAWHTCSALTSAPDVSALTKVTTLAYTWCNCYALTNAPNVSPLTNVTTMASCWQNCSNLVSDVLYTILPPKLGTARYSLNNALAVPSDLGVVVNLATTNAYFSATWANALLYSTTGGMLSTNIANGFSFDWAKLTMSNDECANVLIDLDTSAATGGTCTLDDDNGDLDPGAAGWLAYTNLVGKSWTVTF